MKRKVWRWVIAGAMMLSGGVTRAFAVSAVGFDAGYIMSDYQMGNYGSMSEGEIQAFLTARNGCGNRDYNYYLQLSANRSYTWHWADGHFVCLSEERFGDGEVIGSGETAAHIIWQAAQDYRINPQVLIVNLQKESSLVTDPIPNNGDYRKAMGYGCPDATGCAVRYYGFKNQVRNAAALFRTVMDGGWTNYPVGNNYIAYNPNAACGGSVVNVRNRATSALYRYTPYQPNAGALAAGYGTATCGAYGNRNFYLYFQDWFGGITSEGYPSVGQVNASVAGVSDVGSDLGLEYQAHLEHFGWMGWTSGARAVGSVGYSLRMEALQLKLKGVSDGGIEYRVHVEDVGWMNYVKDGAAAGTTGQSRRVEAVQIRLTGDVAKRYDVYYRVHVQDIGWMGWVKNDEVAGTTGRGLRMEAVQVRLVKKDLGYGPSVSVHVAEIGWMDYVRGGNKVVGTTGRGLRMEAIKIKKADGGVLPTGEISYRAHVANIGWMNWVSSGVAAGTTGRGLQMEAVQVQLNGELAKKYDVYYRAHVQDIGWMAWVKNGEVAGTTGRGLRMEAVQVELVGK